jgi:hypothetical protein
MSERESSWFGESRCKLGSKDIVGSTPSPPILTNSSVDMVGFMDPHKVVARRNAFKTFPSAQNGVELKGWVEDERLKCQFSKVKGDLDLQEIFKPIFIQKKKTPKKKLIMVKDKNEKGEKVGKKIHCV